MMNLSSNTPSHSGSNQNDKTWFWDVFFTPALCAVLYILITFMLFFCDFYEPAPYSGVYLETATVAQTFGIKWVPSPGVIWVGLIIAIVLGWVLSIITRSIYARKRAITIAFNYTQEYRSQRK